LPRRAPQFLTALFAVCALAPGARAQVTATGVTLAWTAPGDDGTSGQASRYDLRWSTAPIVTLADFAQATAVTGLPAPQPAGGPESFAVGGLTPQTSYWFALVTYDESGNGSGLSNTLQVSTLVSSDVIRPAPVALALDAADIASVTVSWTDVGDDSLTGNATAMELRWSTAPITDATWASATVVFGVPQPGAPGTPHQMTIGGLDRTRDLWFAARARDDVNRMSTVASSLQAPHLLDTAPPSSPVGLAASVETGGVHVHWSPNSEPDLAGYRVYRALAALGTYLQLNATPVVPSDFVDAGAPDTLAVWYSVSAVDATGNESARSAPLQVWLRGAGIAAWSVATPYPNPSRVGSPVTLPVAVPPAGPYDAVVEIQDAAGEHVRTLRIANAAPGSYALVWDGRNDAGRATAPGLYRAWLKGGDHRTLARLVRTP